MAQSWNRTSLTRARAMLRRKQLRALLLVLRDGLAADHEGTCTT
jgi:hypothetical protein